MLDIDEGRGPTKPHVHADLAPTFKYSSVEMAKKPENTNIEGAGLHTF